MHLRRFRFGCVVMLGLLFAGWLAATGCSHEPYPEVGKLPGGVEVENPGHLGVAVVPTGKRALTAAELPPLTRAGVLWEHSVRFNDTTGVGTQFREVQVTVRSLMGFATARTIPLSSRVEPRGMTSIQIEGLLVTSDPDEPGNLRGIEEAVFIGQDDRGQPIRLTIRIPLA